MPHDVTTALDCSDPEIRPSIVEPLDATQPYSPVRYLYFAVSSGGIGAGASGDRPAIRGVIERNKADWFAAWSEVWKEETSGYSSINRKVEHPAFKAIVGLGEGAIPMILQDLRDSPAHWFPALKRLVGMSPVRPEHRGNVEEMRQAWLRWGREAGYLED